MTVPFLLILVNESAWIMENHQKNPPLENFITIQDNDVKPGAGNHSHPGNRYYIQLIDENKKAFVLADSKKKKSIVNQVYSQIRQLDPPGRFLERKADRTWGIKDKDSALKKVRRALLEHNATMIENMMKRGEWTAETEIRKRKKRSQSQSLKTKQENNSKIDLLIEATTRFSN